MNYRGQTNKHIPTHSQISDQFTSSLSPKVNLILRFSAGIENVFELIFQQRDFSVFLLDLPPGFAQCGLEFSQVLLEIGEPFFHQPDLILQLLFVVLQLLDIVLKSDWVKDWH